MIPSTGCVYQLSRLGQLLWTLLDTDDSSLGINSVFKLCETPVSSASYVQDSVRRS